MNDTLEIADTLDRRYALRRLIAGNENGSILMAEHLLLGRRVTVHIAGDSEESRTRLVHEAQRLYEAPHRAVLALIDVAESDDGTTYMVTEPIDGRTLDGLIAVRERLSVAEAVNIVVDIGAALDAAHARGVLHAGLSPGSILVGARGNAKLIGYGSWPSPLSSVGGALGAMAYAAPERFTGAEATPRCDVHALGAVLYEATVGEPPPRDQRDPETLYARLGEKLGAVLACALGPADERYAQPAELIDALRDALRAEDAGPQADAVSISEVAVVAGRERRSSYPEIIVSPNASIPPDLLSVSSHPPKDERRVHARVGYVSPVRVRTKAGDAIDGRVEQISEGGLAALVYGEGLNVGEELLVRFSLPGSGRVVSIPSELRWVRPTGVRYAIGVQFEEPGEAVTEDIRRYVTMMGG